MSRPKAPCGTDGAYRRHLRDGEPVDEACRAAHASAGRDSRSTPAPVVAFVEETPADDDSGDDPDDMQLILDTLRTAFKAVADEDPTKLAPIAREFRAAVECVRGPVQPPKELSLAEQLAEARRARAAKAQGSGASA